MGTPLQAPDLVARLTIYYYFIKYMHIYLYRDEPLVLCDSGKRWVKQCICTMTICNLVTSRDIYLLLVLLDAAPKPNKTFVISRNQPSTEGLLDMSQCILHHLVQSIELEYSGRQ